MESKFDLTIVLPVYNGGRSITRTLESLKNQSNQEFNFLIINNNSNDNTKEICLEFEKFFQSIEIINSKTTVPMFANWNKFVDLTTSKYIAMIHADDWYEENYVEDISKILNNQSNPDLIICNANIVDGDQKLLAKLEYQKNKLKKKDVLKTFPGIQRHVWRRDFIKYRFNGRFFPIFDYVWFYLNLMHVGKIDYLNACLVNITSDENQTTNKVSWIGGIFKSIIFMSVRPYPDFKLKTIGLYHLWRSLIGHLKKRIKYFFSWLKL